MAQTIDFYIDVGNGQLVAAGSGFNGTLPTFTRNDVYTFRVRLQERDTDGYLRDVDTTGTSVKIGVGEIDEAPSEGAFKLILNSVTSSAITYTSDESLLASRIYTAVSNNVATPISQFGTEPDAFILTATGTNTALSFSGDSFTLFPSSSVLVSTRRNQAANIQSQQIIKLRRSPAVYADNFTASSTAGVVSLSKLQDGGSGKNETYKLSIGKDAEGGGIIFNYGSNSTTAVAIGSTAVSFQDALSSVTGIGANNISVESGNNQGDYTISFVRELGNIDVTTAFTVDASNVIFAKFLQSTVTFGTSELDELFASEGTTTIAPTLEIEITKSGNPKTIYQGSVSVRKDLITTGSAIPAQQASYYTKSEVDSLFVEDTTSNVDATSRVLHDSSSTDSVDWQNRKLYDGAVEYLRWDNGLGFFNSTAISKPTGSNLINSVSNLGLLSYSTPTQTNVVSNLVTAGLLSSSATYGVLPTSVRTLTTTASLNFGTFTAHDTLYQNVTITGADTNDIVLIGRPNTTCLGLVYSGHVIAANTVCIGAHNTDNTTLNSVTQTFRITVIGY